MSTQPFLASLHTGCSTQTPRPPATPNERRSERRSDPRDEIRNELQQHS